MSREDRSFYEDHRATVRQRRICVNDVVAARAGSVSAEHGIGIEKRPWLSLSRSPAEIELMRRLKQALDPRGILNPGKIL